MPTGRQRPSWGAELPNDNPALFRGVSWLVPSPCAAPSALLVPDADHLRYPGSTQPLQAPTATGTDFERFVGSVVSVLLTRGETRLAAVLQEFLEAGELRIERLDPACRARLLERGWLEQGANGEHPAAALKRVSSAWRRVLAGEQQGLDACGEQTLDHWTSAWLAACLGCDATGLGELRRELRRSGVAAFGMVAA